MVDRLDRISMLKALLEVTVRSMSETEPGGRAPLVREARTLMAEIESIESLRAAVDSPLAELERRTAAHNKRRGVSK